MLTVIRYSSLLIHHSIVGPKISFNVTIFFIPFQSYCQRHSLNQKRKDSDDSEDESKGKRKHMTAEERSLARRQKYVQKLALEALLNQIVWPVNEAQS